MQQKKVVPCEVYSRVVGYIRPVCQWNPGKQEEFRERATLSVPNMETPEIAPVGSVGIPIESSPITTAASEA